MSPAVIAVLAIALLWRVFGTAILLAAAVAVLSLDFLRGFLPLGLGPVCSFADLVRFAIVLGLCEFVIENRWMVGNPR